MKSVRPPTLSDKIFATLATTHLLVPTKPFSKSREDHLKQQLSGNGSGEKLALAEIVNFVNRSLVR